MGWEIWFYPFYCTPLTPLWVENSMEMGKAAVSYNKHFFKKRDIDHCVYFHLWRLSFIQVDNQKVRLLKLFNWTWLRGNVSRLIQDIVRPTDDLTVLVVYWSVTSWWRHSARRWRRDKLVASQCEEVTSNLFGILERQNYRPIQIVT